MKSAGIDIGSRTVKLVVLEDGKITHIRKGENSFDPLKVCAEFLQGVDYDVITATGYGRHLFSQHYPCEVISEIKAFASGARHLFPNCRTILDIGGQDTKAISLAVDGKLLKFEMNDKCAAGTGRFLEIMAMALGYSLTDFGQAACQAK
ncbi:MAG: 3-hydroxyacyl-ACP dehydratase, partial [candidate division KSB1 bacterium]|nr:3-hydroxyacyl-ACP dehydratase [candidate division KSB1 bacterium]